MSTGAGQEVGKISIRVVPELGTFRTMMAAEFAKWNDLTVNIKAKAVGTAAAKAAVADAAKDQAAKITTTEKGAAQAKKVIKDAAKNQIAKIKVVVDDAHWHRFEKRVSAGAEGKVAKFEPTLNLTAQDEMLRRKIENQLQLVKAMGDIPIHPDPQIATESKMHILAEEDRLLRMMQAHADRNRIKVGFEAVDNDARDQMQKNLNALERSNQRARDEVSRSSARDDISRIPGNSDRLHSSVTMKAELDTAEADLKLAAWRAYHSNNMVIPAKIKPDVNMSAFARARFAIEAMFSNIKVNIKERSSLVGATAESLLEGAAGGIAKTGTSAASSLPSLFSFGGIILIIAAAIAVLLPPLLALVAGFSALAPSLLALTVPAAAIALGLEGIKKAATDAGLFADENGDKKGGGTVGAALLSIKEAVSGEFAKQLTEPFKQLGTLFPVIQESMVGVAGGLSKMAAGFIESVTTGQGLKDVNNIIDNVGVGLANAAPGIKSFTDGLMRLVSGISEKFPGIGTWFSELGAKFSKNMTEWTTIPQDNGMTKLENLIANVRTGIEGLTGVFQAFWNQGMKDIQDPNFGVGMQKFFDSVKVFVTETLPSLSAGFKQIAGLMDQLAPIFKLAELNPMSQFEKLKDKLPDFGPLSGIMPTFSNPTKTKKDGETNGTAYREGFQNGFSGGIVTNPRGFAPPQTPAPGAGAEGGADTGWLESFKSKVNEAITTIKGTFTGLWTIISAQATAALTGLGAKISAFFLTLPTLLGGIAASIGSTITGALAGALNIIAIMPSLIAAAFSQLPGIVAGALQNIGTFFITKGAEIAAEVGTWPGRIGAALSGLAGAVMGAIAAAFAEVVATIQAKGSEAATEVGTWPGKFVAALGDLGGLLKSSGAALIGGFISGITSRIGDVADAARSVVAAARRFFPFSPAKEGPFSGKGWVTYSGKSIGEGFADGIGQSTDGVVSTAKALMQAVKDVFGSANGVIFNFNFGGAQRQMDSLATSAGEFQQNMADSVAPVTDINTPPPGLKAAKIGATTQAELDGYKQQADNLGVQIAQLRANKNGQDKAGKAAIQAQIDELNARKANVNAIASQIKYNAQYSEEAQAAQKQKDLWEGMPEKLSSGVQGVAKGVASSYMQDVGIGGGGALGAIADYGMSFANNAANKFVFNVGSPDEANAIANAQTRRLALPNTGR